MVSFGTYATLSIGIPASALGIFAFTLPMILGLFLLFFYFRTCHRLPGFIGKLIVANFEEELAGERKYEYYICGQKVNTVTVAAISCVTILQLLCAFIAFWNTFLTDSVIGCADATWDCFPLDKLNGSLLFGYDQPLNGSVCEKFEAQTNITILCFKFVFLYAEGLSEAGGLVFALTLATNLYIGVFVLINRIKSLFLKRIARYCAGLTGVVVFLLPVILFIPAESRETIRTPNRALQFALYMLTLFFVVFVLGFSMCLYIPKFDLETELRRRATRKIRSPNFYENQGDMIDAIDTEMGLTGNEEGTEKKKNVRGMTL